MSYVADLHVHSPFARGTSRRLTFDGLAHWAKVKGIDLLATGDFTHPVWIEETRTRLADAGNGLFTLGGVHFVLGTELSCVASQGGRSRRVHMLALAPELETVDRINSALAAHGNLAGDGRPVLRLTPRDLLETLLEIDDRCLAIPAHLWTPWYGLYGSKSGFDSLEESFGDLADLVPAVETGLSSDPAMNWRVPSLDDVSLVSFSDAHSPAKLGRELTVFDGDPSYDGLAHALRTGGVRYTVEFFPEEGKYHHSGHRKCGVRYTPEQVAAEGARCPACGRPLTIGVLQRVEELSRRVVEARRGEDGLVRSNNGRPPFRSLVALADVVAEALGCRPQAKKAVEAYGKLVSRFGNELTVLVDAPIDDIAAAAGDRTAEGVRRVRSGDILIEPGYDGEYGAVKIFGQE